MADKSFGVDQLDILGTGTPTISAPNQLNLDAHTVAISTSVTVGEGMSAVNISATGISTIAQPADSNPMANWTITNNSASAYRFTGPGQSGSDDNPDLYLVRGHRYIFKHNATGSHPIQIRVASGGAAYTDGVTYSNTGNNTTTDGNNLIINLQHDAPARLFYQCTSHGGMVGNIYTVGGPQVISGVVTATTFSGSGASLTNLPSAQLTGALPALDGSNLTGISGVSLSGSTNNTVATVTGANALIGEGNLKFDGTNLGVGVDPSGVASYSTIHLKGQTSGNGGAVRLTDYGDTPDSDDFTIYKNSTAGYLRINGTDPLIAYMNGAERFYIDSTGRISAGKHGVGTYNDASEWFKVQSNDTAANISIVGSNDTHSSLNLGDEDDFNIQKIRSDHTNNSLQFFTDNTERLRITSDGDVNINSSGLSSPYSSFRRISINNNLILNAANSAGGFAGMQNNAYLNSSGNWVRVNNDHATSIGTDDGNFYFRNAGAGTGNISWNQRLNILANGNIGINRTNPSSLLHIQTGDTSTYNINSAVTNGILTVSSNAGSATGRCVGMQINGPTSNGEAFITMVGISNSESELRFGMRSGGSRGDRVTFEPGGRVRMPGVYSTNGSNMRDVQIESDGTLCAGNTSVRASKTNIQSLSDVSWLYDLNPVTFNYRKRVKDIMSTKYNYLDEAESETSYGLIAEEVETVKKDFCFYNKDENNDDELSGVHYNQLITPLLKAIQDQKKEIDTLKAKVAALEGS